jgi:acetyltransferase-like isoleucine patch superfamily enzyme
MRILFFLKIYKGFLKLDLYKIKSQIASANKWSEMEIGEGVILHRSAQLVGAGFVVVGNEVQLSNDIQIRVNDPDSKIFIGTGTRLDKNTKLICRGSGEIRIGDRSRIAPGVTLICEDGGLVELGDDVIIGESVKISTNSSVFIGNKSHIQMYTTIAPREKNSRGNFHCGEDSNIHCYNFIDTTANIIMGKAVRTGPYDVFYTHEHTIKGKGLIWENPIETAEIIIRDGVWVGSGVTILPGVSVGNGAVIAAGAVVNKSIMDFEVVGGIPARIIKDRTITIE